MKYQKGQQVLFTMGTNTKEGRIRSSFYGQVEDYGYLSNVYSVRGNDGVVYADIEEEMISNLHENHE